MSSTINYTNECENWHHVLSKLGLDNAKLLYVSNHCTDIRVYDHGASVIKIRRLTHSSLRRRINTFLDEYIVMKKMEEAGINNIPNPIHYKRIGEFEAIECTKLPPIPTVDPTLKHRRNRIALIWATTKFVFALNMRGFSHGDIHGANIGLNEKGGISCFDFDQATSAHPIKCLSRDFLGITVAGCASQTSLFNRLVTFQLDKIFCKVRRLLGLPQAQIQNLLNNYSERCAYIGEKTLEQLSEAWAIAEKSNASSPGTLIAYYSLDIGGIHFPGQRPWPLRWEAISRSIDFRNKRFLELGCNMGLLSIHAKMAGAASCHGVDIDGSIIEAASRAAAAFNAEIDFSNVDFDSSEAWEASLQNYDLVSCLSVIYWVKDKKRLGNFLGKFPEILFEGHATGEEDQAFVKSLGFRNVTVLTLTERNRPLIHGTK